MEPQKALQIEYHEREHYCAVTPRRPDNSHPVVAFLNTYRLTKLLELIGEPLEGATILCTCGGDGDEADFLQRRGAAVTTTDLSVAALEAAQLRNPALRVLRMDAESLAFADRSFDWAIVREGLHHLPRPVKGLYELERVSRKGFAILEAQDSIAVRALGMLGMAHTRDPAGGYVYRFGRRELDKIFASLGTVSEYRIHAAWLPYGNDVLKLFPAFRRLAYPLMNQHAARRLLSARAARRALKGVYALLNRIIGRWGNCLIVVARKAG
jgi:SAM-dependent methyltransferase